VTAVNRQRSNLRVGGPARAWVSAECRAQGSDRRLVPVSGCRRAQRRPRVLALGGHNDGKAITGLPILRIVVNGRGHLCHCGYTLPSRSVTVREDLVRARAIADRTQRIVRLAGGRGAIVLRKCRNGGVQVVL